jgi:hypothetical protein
MGFRPVEGFSGFPLRSTSNLYPTTQPDTGKHAREPRPPSSAYPVGATCGFLCFMQRIVREPTFGFRQRREPDSNWRPSHHSPDTSPGLILEMSAHLQYSAFCNALRKCRSDALPTELSRLIIILSPLFNPASTSKTPARLPAHACLNSDINYNLVDDRLP